MQILSAHPVSIFRTQIFLRTFYACVGASVLTLFTPPPQKTNIYKRQANLFPG